MWFDTILQTCSDLFFNFTLMSKLVLKTLMIFDTILQIFLDVSDFELILYRVLQWLILHNSTTMSTLALKTLMRFNTILQMSLDVSNFEMLWNMHEQALICLDKSEHVWTCLKITEILKWWNMLRNYRFSTFVEQNEHAKHISWNV
jgi:hypothetical protein